MRLVRTAHRKRSSGPLTTGLIEEFILKNGSGTTVPNSASGASSRTLTTSGSPTRSSTGLDFSGGTKYASASLSSVTLSQMSAYAVLKWPTANAPGNATYVGVFGGEYGSAAWHLAGGTNAAVKQNPVFRFKTIDCAATTAWLRDGAWHVLHAHYDGTTLYLYVDDVLVATATASAQSATYAMLQISSLNLALTFPGSIYYASLYNVCHSASERTANRAALAALAAGDGITLQSVLPYVLVAEGDSISTGAAPSGTVPFPTLGVQAMTTIMQGRNFAVSGSTVTGTTSLTARASQVDALYDARRTRNILTVLIGRNDLLGTPDPTTFLANLRTYCAARRAVGWRVGVGAILPSTASGVNTARGIANPIIRSEVGTSWDFVIDYAADATIGPDAAASDTTYYQDGTHPTQATQTIMGGIYATAVQAAA